MSKIIFSCFIVYFDITIPEAPEALDLIQQSI
jgi:hypothetical protein